MSRAAVTKAQLNRLWDVLQARGETVVEVRPMPDGSYSFRLTGGGGAVVPSDDDAEAAWDKALGLQ